jgi:hypothetical protein
MKNKTLLIIGACLGLASCTPQEAVIAEEVVIESIKAEQAIQEAITKPRAPPVERKKVDDRTAPVQIAKRTHDDVTRPKKGF